MIEHYTYSLPLGGLGGIFPNGQIGYTSFLLFPYFCQQNKKKVAHNVAFQRKTPYICTASIQTLFIYENNINCSFVHSLDDFTCGFC